MKKRAAPGQSHSGSRTTEGGANKKGGGRPGRQKRTSILCQVPGCGLELVHAKGYYKRYRICMRHCSLSCIRLDGSHMRFCQQCGRFHTLERFDGEKKSCRERLQWHNERRRLAQARTALRAGGKACSQAPMLEDSAQEEDEELSTTLTASTVPLTPSPSNSEATSEMQQPLPTEPECCPLPSPTSQLHGAVKEEPPAPVGLSQDALVCDTEMPSCTKLLPSTYQPFDQPAGNLLPPNPIWRTDTGESSSTQLLAEETEQLQDLQQQQCEKAAWQKIAPPVVSLAFPDAHGFRCGSPALSAIPSLEDLDWLLPVTGVDDDSGQERSQHERGLGVASPLLLEPQQPGLVGGVHGPWQDLFADQLPKLGPWRAQPSGSSPKWAPVNAVESGLEATAQEEKSGRSDSLDEMDEEPTTVEVLSGSLPPGSPAEVLAMDTDAALGPPTGLTAVKDESLPAHDSPAIPGAVKQAHALSCPPAQLSAFLPSGGCMAHATFTSPSSQQPSPPSQDHQPPADPRVEAVVAPTTPQQLVTKRLPPIKIKAEPPAPGHGLAPAGGSSVLQAAAMPALATRPTFTASALSYVAAAAAAEAAAKQNEVATTAGRLAVAGRAATGSGGSLLPGTPLNLLPTPQQQPLTAAAGATPRFFMDSGGSIKLGLPSSGREPGSGQQSRTVPLPVLVTNAGPEAGKVPAAAPLVPVPALARQAGLATAQCGPQGGFSGGAQGVSGGPATALAEQAGVARRAAGAPVYSGKPVQR